MFKRLIGIATAVATISTMAVTAFADEPYDTYSYDNWQDPIPSQAGYMVEKTWMGHDLGLDKLSDPDSKFFISKSESPNLNAATDIYVENSTRTIWVADTGNNRILKFSEEFQLLGCYKTIDGAETSTFSNPRGIFVEIDKDKNTILYVADTENSRAVKLKITSHNTCELVQDFLKPTSQAYSAEAFSPSKVLVDKEGNVYLVATTVNTGALRYDKNGEFKGYFGANRVQQTAQVIAKKVWRIFASEEQLQAVAGTVPTEFHNFDMDEDGFIYTVTESVNADTDAVKKLNPAGYNIWNNAKGNTYTFGDIARNYDEGMAKKTKLTDIAVGDNEVFNVLDYETGRVFQYDKNADLLFIFGTKSYPSEQEGSFTAPNAVETLGTRVYVLDGLKNDITVFNETVFGKYVHEASVLNVEGKYTEAQPIWEEVLKRDGGYTMAHVALGKACLNAGEYKQAMKYFKTAYDQENYDKAYEYYRDEFLREHFEIIVIGLVVFFILVAVYSHLKKKKIIWSITECLAFLLYKIAGAIKSLKRG